MQAATATAPEPALDWLLERLDSAARPECLRRLTPAVRDHFGVDHAAYHWLVPLGIDFSWGTYPAEWTERYRAQGYSRIDPVVAECLRHLRPVDWRDLDWNGRAAKKLREESCTFGIGSQGLTVPIRGPNGQLALFSLNSACSQSEWTILRETRRRDLILIAHMFNHKVLEFEQGHKPHVFGQLSPREAESITLLAMGCSRAQIADRLAISEHTVRDYIESARRKLGAMNTIHAVARAIQGGLILM